MFHVHGGGRAMVKRSERDEAALRIAMIEGLHLREALQRCQDELGNRAKQLGPIDLSRNPMQDYVVRRAKAYLTPAAAFSLGLDLALVVGDSSARTTVERYAAIGARPLPSRMVAVSQDALRYRLAANWTGTLVGWSDSSARVYLEVVSPADLELEYLSDDPERPTVIRHHRWRVVGGERVQVCEVYDLTDEKKPSYRIMRGNDDVTQRAAGRTFVDDEYWWRYEDGRPFHRIVVSGNPHVPYRGIELVEGTLGMAALGTNFRAAFRDAGFPQRSAINLELRRGVDTTSPDGQTGVDAGPEVIVQWQHSSEDDRPGSLHQFAPGFDPSVMDRVLRSEHLRLVESTGLPVDYSGTGGEPTEHERRALDEQIAATYDGCRTHDSLVLRRAAATANRAREASRSGERPIPEIAYAILYRGEVAEALASMTPPPAPPAAEAPPPAPPEDDSPVTEEEPDE